MLAPAPVASTAAFTVSNTGTPCTSLPPLPGVTPPTILVPAAIISSVWKAPILPVMPWTRTRVVSSMRMAMAVPLRLGWRR